MKKTINTNARIKEFKRVERMEVTEEMISSMLSPTIREDFLTQQDIAEIGSYFTVGDQVKNWMNNPKIDPNLRLALEALRAYNPDKLHHTLNTLSAERDYFQVMVGKLADRLTTPNFPTSKEFDLTLVRIYMAAQLLSTMIDLKYIELTEKLEFVINEDSGKGEWKTQQMLSFGNAAKQPKYKVSGISMTPGTVLQKEYKVQAGGKARKLNKQEKELLSLASSFKLRLVDIPLELLERYMKVSPWYTNVIEGVVKMDKIQADELVYEALVKYKILSSLDGFYLPMWLDYRTRLYYHLTEMGFNPHGKQFETCLFEAAEPYMITSIVEYAYSAVVLIDGRMPHHIAIEKFLANKEHYMEALRAPLADDASVDEMGEWLYNSRLAYAIDSYYNGEETHFLLSEDATNGGLQHGGIGFHSMEMMIPANVGGAPEQLDSHGNLQTQLGLASRDTAKEIHQPLLHGSSMNTLAGVLECSVREAEAFIVKAYGRSALNIEKIADWGVAIANNINTSLLWKTRDGFNAQSIAYVETVPLTVRFIAERNKQGWGQLLLHKDMPLLKSAKGELVYGSGTSIDKLKVGGKVKNRGLYANITHSIDATALRDVIRATGGKGLWKHDNFLVPGTMETVRRAYKIALLEEYGFRGYEAAMIDILENYQGLAPQMPTLTYGSATRDAIINSHYYLAP